MVLQGQPAPEDIFGCQTAMFEWAESYDEKDWDRFLRNTTPTLEVRHDVQYSGGISNAIQIDYRKLMNKYWEAIPAIEFIEMVSALGFLGNPRVKSSHFVGASRYEQQDESHIIGTHQMRVAHQSYTDDTLSAVQRRGHASGNCTVHYRKVDGVWKWAGLLPGIR